MQLAELILSYIKVLIWPTVVITGLLIFKKEIRIILSRVKKLTLPGGTELDMVKNYFELESNQSKFSQAEEEIEELLVNLINKLQVDQKEKVKIINQLEEKNNRLKEAYSRVNEIAVSEIFESERGKILEECIKELSDDSKEFINFWLENPNEEAKKLAEKFDTTVNKTFVRKHRIIKQLNKCYQEKLADL